MRVVVALLAVALLSLALGAGCVSGTDAISGPACTTPATVTGSPLGDTIVITSCLYLGPRIRTEVHRG